MKGKVVIIGTMGVDGEELTGVFIECDHSELDGTMLYENVEIVELGEKSLQERVEILENEIREVRKEANRHTPPADLG